MTAGTLPLEVKLGGKALTTTYDTQAANTGTFWYHSELLEPTSGPLTLTLPAIKGPRTDVQACRVDVVDAELVPEIPYGQALFTNEILSGDSQTLRAINEYSTKMKSSLQNRGENWKLFGKEFESHSADIMKPFEKLGEATKEDSRTSVDLSSLFDLTKSTMRCTLDANNFHLLYGFYTSQAVMTTAPSSFVGKACEFKLAPVEGAQNADIVLAEMTNADTGETIKWDKDDFSGDENKARQKFRFVTPDSLRRIKVRLLVASDNRRSLATFELNRLADGWQKAFGEPKVLGLQVGGQTSTPSYVKREDAEKRLVVGEGEKIFFEVPITLPPNFSMTEFTIPFPEVVFQDKMVEKCLGLWRGRGELTGERKDIYSFYVSVGGFNRGGDECKEYLSKLPQTPLVGRLKVTYSFALDPLDVELAPIVVYSQETSLFDAIPKTDSARGNELVSLEIRNKAPFNLIKPTLSLRLQCKDDRPGAAAEGGFTISAEGLSDGLSIGETISFSEQDIKEAFHKYWTGLPSDRPLKGCRKSLDVTSVWLTQGVKSLVLGTQEISLQDRKIVVTPP